MNCQFCSRAAEPRENLEVGVCHACWRLLQNPTTALPLIRGHLTLTLRGKVPDTELRRQIDAFMTMIASWSRRIEPS
jgi:hypothetical protein